MQTPFPNISTRRLKKSPLIAPGSFHRAGLYRFKGKTKPTPRRAPRPLLVMEQQGLGFPQRKGSPTNILFRYLYRDACNFKQYGESIFTNHTFLLPDEIEKQIRACLKDGEFFIAGQVNIEERFFDAIRADDHPWHEFERVDATTLAAFDPDNWARRQHRRDITEFLADLERAQKAGWDEMNVRADLQRLLEHQKTTLRLSLEK